jgi:ParB-like chromosome segregation protein Spo0J
MKIEKIPLYKLLAHPSNANVMSAEALRKLRRHIENHGFYEPLAVRPHPDKPNCYQLLNGHHRKCVLEQLEHRYADCVVWQVNDEQALMLLATLNRLSGQDDPYKRADLLEKLSQRFGQEELLKQLPEKREQLEKLLAVRRPPEVNEPQSLPEIPLAMTFFVSGEQKETIETSLRKVREEVGGDDPEQKLTKGDLLAILAEQYVKKGI